ncbi:MAG: DnaA regulatory inactivator Hda [Gammaproteobacteria bacterium]|nr:DnaA regulatory inactivator Hda [Gammaproteobacteria bacterium]
MNSSNPQQALNLQLAQANTFETYYPGSDATLVSVLKNVASGVLEEPQIFLWGVEGTGKTHLLQAMCRIASESHKRAMYIPMKDLLTQDPASIGELQDLDLVCIDDVQVIAKNPQWEKALFNFINHHRSQKTIIVISSLSEPTETLFELADLNSRAVWGPVYKLTPLEEPQLNDALNFHVKVRGLDLSDEVKNYLLTRYKRDVSSMVKMVDVLDKASLEEQRKVTIPFLKKTLATLPS